MAVNSTPAGKVLITGATGFVGKSLCEHLGRAGVEIVRALRTPLRNRSVQANDVVIGELGARTVWDQALQNVDAVVHLAAHVHRMGASPQGRYLEVNCHATDTLARCAHSAGVKHFVFMSSVKVHGEQTEHGEFFRETDLPAPQDSYAQSKWQAEQRLADISAQGGMAVSILRPPLVYGPGVGANFLALLRLAASGWPLPLGAIQNARSLIHVENLVSVIARVLSVAPTSKGVHTYLVSDQKDLSTTELVSLMREAMGLPRRLYRLPRAILELASALAGRTDQLRRLTESLRVDSSKLTAELAWRPPVSIAEGIARTCKWYQANQSGLDRQHA